MYTDDVCTLLRNVAERCDFAPLENFLKEHKGVELDRFIEYKKKKMELTMQYYILGAEIMVNIGCKLKWLILQAMVKMNVLLKQLPTQK